MSLHKGCAWLLEFLFKVDKVEEVLGMVSLSPIIAIKNYNKFLYDTPVL
jgi:hypothetical protein